jgi:NYN domain
VNKNDCPVLPCSSTPTNTSPQIVGGLFEEVAKFGEASVRRIYGDFSGSQLRSWAGILQKHAIDPYQQFAYTKGKNAADIALVIDAMDLLHSGRFDGFCLVSSDSDFTRLASRLREEGADVYGFGAQKTPESFRQACRRFIYTENLLPEAVTSGADAPSKPKSLQPPSAAIPILKRPFHKSRARTGGCCWEKSVDRSQTCSRISTCALTAIGSSAISCGKQARSTSNKKAAARASGPSPPTAARRCEHKVSCGRCAWQTKKWSMSHVPAFACEASQMGATIKSRPLAQTILPSVVVTHPRVLPRQPYPWLAA